ncbi:MAG: transcriptional regulator [Ruminococcus sp.]|nr:transcriptional regulator [Ruminococcus sp.]
MKLIFAIVNGDDSQPVSNALMENGFFATKLASTGGFLSSGNTTFLICTENERVDDAINVIASKSRKRKEFVKNSMSGLSSDSFSSFPMEVQVGGATIFVTDVERFEKV